MYGIKLRSFRAFESWPSTTWSYRLIRLEPYRLPRNCSNPFYLLFRVTIIIIIIIILVITFTLGIYSYIPVTNHVSRVYIVAAVLCLQFLLHVLLLRPSNMFRTFTLTLSVVCVQCPIWLFFYFLNFVLSVYVSQVPPEWFWNGSSGPHYYRYHFVFILHMRWISILTSLYVTILSAPFWIAFLSPGLATDINMLMARTDRQTDKQAADMKDLVFTFRNYTKYLNPVCFHKREVLLYVSRNEYLKTSSLFPVGVHKSAQLPHKMYNKIYLTCLY